MRVRALIALAVVGVSLALGLATGSTASNVAEPWRLKKVASVFANRQVYVWCRTKEDDGTLSTAWGYVYVPTAKQPYTTIDRDACNGALDIRDDNPRTSDFLKGIGAAVLVHESYHLRDIPGNQDEARTECRAMRHYDVVLRLLGASDAMMDRLMPIMLIQHWYLRAWSEHRHWRNIDNPWDSQPTYHRPGCKMPLRYDRWRGFPPRP